MTDLSGRWRFSPQQSRLQIRVPDAVELRIDHRGLVFRLERTLTFGDHVDTFALELSVGGPCAPLDRGGATLHPTLEWEGDELVFVTRIERPGDTATNVVRYRLQDGGRMLIAKERFASAALQYDNLWVFTKE